MHTTSGNVVYLPIGWPLPEEAPPVIEDGVEISIEQQIAELEAELAGEPAAAREIARADRRLDEAERAALLLRGGAEITLREEG